MPALPHYRRRRDEFLSRLDEPVLLLAGGDRPRNFPANHYPYRADSNFLFFFGKLERDAAALFDPGDGSVTLFLPRRTTDAAVWLGSVPSFDEMQEVAGVDRVLDVEHLEEHVAKLRQGRRLLSVAVMDPVATRIARQVTGLELRPDHIGPPELVDVLADLRLHKNEDELAEMREAADATGAAFTAAMAATGSGVTELSLAADAEWAMARRGATPAFSTVLSVRGEILHNQSHGGALQSGDLVLMDGGAEVPSGYAADVTRTWPVSGRFSAAQRSVYDIVLRAVRVATEMVRPGVRYRDIHFRAAAVIAEGLAELGLMKGDPARAVERGAHAAFFPHGVGHLLGLDVHDLESFGDRVLYGPGRDRSSDFGTKYLRIDLDLEAGMVVTIEPGLYFVPAILRGEDFRKKFGDIVDFDRAERFLESNAGRGFGGFRIEDDVLVTDDDPEVLTAGIPSAAEDVEAAVGRRARREVGVRA